MLTTAKHIFSAAVPSGVENTGNNNKQNTDGIRPDQHHSDTDHNHGENNQYCHWLYLFVHCRSLLLVLVVISCSYFLLFLVVCFFIVVCFCFLLFLVVCCYCSCCCLHYCIIVWCRLQFVVFVVFIAIFYMADNGNNDNTNNNHHNKNGMCRCRC